MSIRTIRRIVFYLAAPYFNIKYRKNAEAYFNRAWESNHYYSQYDLAIADYNHAIKINPQYDDAYYERGNVYFDRANGTAFFEKFEHRVKDYDLAIADYNRAIAVNPRHAHAYYFKAMACENKGVYEQRWNQEAINAYHNFLTCASPDDTFIKEAKARIQELT